MGSVYRCARPLNTLDKIATILPPTTSAETPTLSSFPMAENQAVIIPPFNFGMVEEELYRSGSALAWIALY